VLGCTGLNTSGDNSYSYMLSIRLFTTNSDLTPTCEKLFQGMRSDAINICIPFIYNIFFIFYFCMLAGFCNIFAGFVLCGVVGFLCRYLVDDKKKKKM
jgi:hypothetical protein